MNTKTISIIIGVIIIAAVAYVAMMQMNTKSSTSAAPEQTTGDTSAAQGKLNIDAICQGALAYMTFPDGAAAEKFVAECKEGKHPEVIEKYKADMNLGAGAQI